MRNTAIAPQKLNGTVMIPPSKSIGHRAIICAALAKGVSTLTNIGISDDIDATVEAMKMLGARIEREGGTLTIDGSNTFVDIQHKTIDCKESGSTLRFLIPLALHCNEITFIGSKRLGQRPLDLYYSLFDQSGIVYETEGGCLPLTIHGGEINSKLEICGNVSSQFITGLLLSLPLLPINFQIQITSPLESKAYVDLTMDVMKEFGVEIHNNNYNTFFIKGGQAYQPKDYYCEGDFSQAAFYLVAGTLGNDIKCKGLFANSRQGDKEILTIIEKMGGQIVVTDDIITAIPSATEGITIDAAQIPDLVPILAVLGALSKGETRIINAQRLRIKESDRLAAISEQLNLLGGIVIQKPDGLIIEGVNELRGAVTNGCNDHRIAMSIAIAATRATEEVVVEDSDCVKKSYPNFWEDYQALGGVICDRE